MQIPSRGALRHPRPSQPRFVGSCGRGSRSGAWVGLQGTRADTACMGGASAQGSAALKSHPTFDQRGQTQKGPGSLGGQRSLVGPWQCPSTSRPRTSAGCNSLPPHPPVDLQRDKRSMELSYCADFQTEASRRVGRSRTKSKRKRWSCRVLTPEGPLEEHADVSVGCNLVAVRGQVPAVSAMLWPVKNTEMGRGQNEGKSSHIKLPLHPLLQSHSRHCLLPKTLSDPKLTRCRFRHRRTCVLGRNPSGAWAGCCTGYPAGRPGMILLPASP